MNLFDVYPVYDLSLVKGEGMYVFDKEGSAYLDLYGGHAVISIGHTHPQYVRAITRQVQKIGYYSNAVKNPLQEELAEKLEELSGCHDHSLFLCNSGAEANENALKLASFHTGRSRVIYFKNSFHGRTSGVVAVTDNRDIQSSFNSHHNVTRLSFGDTTSLQQEMEKGDVAAVILEVIQGVGGLEEATTEFYKFVSSICGEHGSVLIADEVQSGYGRTGDFFAFQKHGIHPGIISMAKGMGNGFPIGGILISKEIEARHGLLGTTFGGNHLACAAGIAVLDVLQQEGLMGRAKKLYGYIKERILQVPNITNLKGRGLMIGLEFDFEVGELRRNLLFKHGIFTGGASNKNLLRILPPLIMEQKHVDQFFQALEIALEELNKTVK